MSWTMTTSQACILKAGANATISSAALIIFSDEVEAQINTLTRKDWVTAYSTVKTNFKKILDDVCSDGVAIKLINYDMSGYTSRTEAQTMLDVLRDNFMRGIETLKDKENQEVMFT